MKAREMEERKESKRNGRKDGRKEKWNEGKISKDRKNERRNE